MSIKKKVSILLPAYNEAGNIERAGRILTELFEKELPEYEPEILFVDDGSSDETWSSVHQLSKGNPYVRGISFSRNFGKEAALFAGLEEVRGDCVIVMDSDLQHPPEAIPGMLKLWEEGYELVEGVKSSRGKESLFHKGMAGLFYKLIHKLTGFHMEKSSDFKLLDRAVINALLSLKERNTFFRALSFWAGFRSTEYAYEVKEREIGKTKWSKRSLFRYAVNNITSFSAAPLYGILGMGVVFVVFALILGIQTLVRFCIGHAVEGFTTVILLLLLIGGLLLIALGIIGYYVGKIYDEVKGRPRYIIARRTEEKK